MRIFPKGWPWKKNIEDLDELGAIYLARTMWIKFHRLGVYTHRIYRPDTARAVHDHPWPFLTVILRGGYEEEIRGRRYMRRPGYIGWRGRGFRHRITALRGESALTLVIRGRNNDRWNFYNKAGEAMDWQDYILIPPHVRVAWCEDTINAE